MVTLKLAPHDATLAAVRDAYAIAPSTIDAGFGVVAVSPAQHLYAILVDEDVARRLTDAPGIEGVHANPRIEPFGPPA